MDIPFHLLLLQDKDQDIDSNQDQDKIIELDQDICLENKFLDLIPDIYQDLDTPLQQEFDLVAFFIFYSKIQIHSYFQTKRKTKTPP